MEDHYMPPKQEQKDQPDQPPSYFPTHTDTHNHNHAREPPSLTIPSLAVDSLHHARTLPPLPQPPLPPTRQDQRRTNEHHPSVWPPSNPLIAYHHPGPSQSSPICIPAPMVDSPKMMEIDAPETRGRRGGSVLSIDDPDVRLAAEALGDLRADFVGSPPQHGRAYPTSPRGLRSTGVQEPEPLLSLLTTSHPLIGTAIGGSLSAYSASKNYSPRFKSSAEYVERRFTPVVNTVGSVGRMTGVEEGVRWFLGGRPTQLSDVKNDDERSNKRRKLDEELDLDRNIPQDPYPVHRQDFYHRQRRPSQSSTVESLPAYDEQRSPSYEAQQALVTTRSQEDSTSPGSSWPSRLVLSTSGLSIAMSEESLRSLKYCLGWLRWANDHIGKVILALKSELEHYDRTPVIEGSSNFKEQGQLVVCTSAERSALNARIASLTQDVLKTLKDVVEIVSKYAGGALPENARVLVRRHLTSLPQRFRLANSRSTRSSEVGEQNKLVTEGANRVLVLAKEGLDMMAQVSGVLDGTIISAEEWCERLGRSKRGEREGEGEEEVREGAVNSGDEKMPLALSGV